jgi:DNA primase
MISDETIAAVKERSDILVLIGENVKLTRKGRSFWGLCPFHKEKSPSFSVNPERGFFHCFGCGKHGGPIDYLIELESLPFPEAVRALAERFGVEVKTTGSREEEAREQRARRDREDLYGVMNLAAVYYEAELQKHPLRRLPLAELERRGLLPGLDATIDGALAAFRIGYAPYRWDGLATYLAKQGVSLESAERVGLISPRRSGDGHYDAFRHRLMFAVLDKSGRVVAFSGRALAEPEAEELRRERLAPLAKPDAGAPPKYYNSPESPIFSKGETVFGLFQARQSIRERGDVLLVEGNFDVVSLHARGLTNVVAPLGTAFTEAQAKLIKRYAPRVTALFDGDAAGRKATLAMRGPARAAGLGVRVASLPEGVDPDDLARKKGIAAVEAVAKGATGMLEHLIEETIGRSVRGGGASREDMVERIRQVNVYLAEEADAQVLSMGRQVLNELARKMVFPGGEAPADFADLEKMVARTVRGQSPREDRRLATGENRKLVTLVKIHEELDTDLQILGALLDYPELFDEDATEEAVAELCGDVALAAGIVRAQWDEKRGLFAPELLALLPRAIHSFAVGRLASPASVSLDDARRELVGNAKQLRRRSLKGDKAFNEQKLARMQALGDEDAEDELLRELARVKREKLRLT